MLALAHEALVADMEVVAVDLSFHAQPDAVFRLLAIGDVGADLASLDAQRLSDRMLEARFRGRGQPEQMPRR